MIEYRIDLSSLAARFLSNSKDSCGHLSTVCESISGTNLEELSRLSTKYVRSFSILSGCSSANLLAAFRIVSFLLKSALERNLPRISMLFTGYFLPISPNRPMIASEMTGFCS